MCVLSFDLFWEHIREVVLTQNQPNVVNVFEIILGKLSSDPAWLIMEWLEHDLDSCRLEHADRPVLLLHVIKGLAFMHGNNCVHRDLKPSNILVHLDQGKLVVAKIADFGNSKHQRSGEMCTYTGSSVYMAPEFFRESLSYTKAIDLWSFGIIAIQLLTEWDVDDEAWNPRSPPSEAQHLVWIKQAKNCRVPAAPKVYQQMLSGVLSISASERWTAPQTEKYLQLLHMAPPNHEAKGANAHRSLSSADGKSLDISALSPIANDSLSHPNFLRLQPAQDRKSLPPTAVSTPIPKVQSYCPTASFADGRVAKDGPEPPLPQESTLDEVEGSNAISRDM